MTRGLSGAYDPHPILVPRIGIGVNHKQQDDRPDNSDGVPALLSVFDPVRQDDMQRIISNP